MGPLHQEMSIVEDAVHYAVWLGIGLFVRRSADRAEVHHEGHGATAADWSPPLLCHPHVRHYWSGVLQWKAPSDLHEQCHRTPR